MIEIFGIIMGECSHKTNQYVYQLVIERSSTTESGRDDTPRRTQRNRDGENKRFTSAIGLDILHEKDHLHADYTHI